MTDRPFVPWYYADFLADTQNLSTEHKGAYLLLLGYSWFTGPLPDDERQLARIAGFTLGVWRKRIAPLVMRYWKRVEGGWIQKRLEMERTKAHKRQAAGQAGAAARHADADDEPEDETEIAAGSQAERSEIAGESQPDRKSIAGDPQAESQPDRSTQLQLQVHPQLSNSCELESERRARATRTKGNSENASEGTRLPANWQPDEDLKAFARELNLDPQSTAERFREFYGSIAGPKAVRANWDLTFKLWCRRQVEDFGGQAGEAEAEPWTLEQLDANAAKWREDYLAGRIQ